MKYINTLQEGDNISEVYLCKKHTSAVTKTGKPYDSVELQDKTGTLSGKIWDPNNGGISDFSEGDYVFLTGNITSFNGALQLNITRSRVADEDEYVAGDYLPCTKKDIPTMYDELLGIIASIQAPYMRTLLESFFKDEEFAKRFQFHSAAKSVHHGFVGGLLEHTLSVAKLCDFYAANYTYLDRDLLLTAAICHDIGKIDELSPYPINDYTDDGQLLGHIMMGAMMVRDRIATIDDFPAVKASELVHCILAHHGELEYGSPKKPAIAEAIALSFADNVDAKLETMKEALEPVAEKDLSWQGFNRFVDSNIRRTSEI